MKNILVFALPLLLANCGAGSSGVAEFNKEREACYLNADFDFWEVVEQCKSQGLDYEECSSLRAAEEKHKKDLEDCE